MTGILSWTGPHPAGWTSPKSWVAIINYKTCIFYVHAEVELWDIAIGCRWDELIIYTNNMFYRIVEKITFDN